MAKCMNCGAEKWTVTERLGALETWRCDVCGVEETVHVYAPDLDPPLPANLPQVFTLIGKWSAKPTARQISELYELFPRLRSISGVELMRKAVDHSSFELGRFTESEVSERIDRLGLLGVETQKIPVEIGSA